MYSSGILKRNELHLFKSFIGFMNVNFNPQRNMYFKVKKCTLSTCSSLDSEEKTFRIYRVSQWKRMLFKLTFLGSGVIQRDANSLKILTEKESFVQSKFQCSEINRTYKKRTRFKNSTNLFQASRGVFRVSTSIKWLPTLATLMI